MLVCDGERGLGASETFMRNAGANNRAAQSPWQKGRVEQRIATVKGSGGQDDLATPSGVEERHVSCQLRGGPFAAPKSREVGHHPSHTSFSPANEGPRRTDGGRFPSEGGGRRRRAGKTFHHSGRQRWRPRKNILLRKRSEEQLPHVPGQ